MEMEKLRYSVEKSSFFVKLTTLFLALSVIFRIIGCWGFRKGVDGGFVYMQVLLPILCCMVFAVIILCCGKKLFILTFIPVVFGAVFFIVRAVDQGGLLRMILCTLVYVATAFAYIGTVFGLIRTKWILPPIFALELAYKLFLDKTVDFAAMSFKELAPELSVMSIILALLCICFAMKKRDFSGISADEQATIDVLIENETPIEEETENAESEAESNE